MRILRKQTFVIGTSRVQISSHPIIAPMTARESIYAWEIRGMFGYVRVARVEQSLENRIGLGVWNAQADSG